MSTDVAALKVLAHTLLQGLVEQLGGLRGCVISTEDGVEVASLHHQSDPDSSARLSAMTSSMAALGTMIASDGGQLGRCGSVVVEAETGLIVMVHARRPDVTLVLSLITGQDAVLDKVLRAARHAARYLERVGLVSRRAAKG